MHLCESHLLNNIICEQNYKLRLEFIPILHSPMHVNQSNPSAIPAMSSLRALISLHIQIHLRKDVDRVESYVEILD